VLLEKRFGIQLIRWPAAQGPDWADINSHITYDAIGPIFFLPNALNHNGQLEIFKGRLSSTWKRRIACRSTPKA
jgi:hypothetical protein